MSNTKKHESKIKEYEELYGFKSLRKIILEFKQDFEMELKNNAEEEKSQSTKEVEVASDDEEYKKINFRNIGLDN